MAYATKLSNVLAKAMADAVTTQLDSGSGACTVTLYSGTQPTGGPDEAIDAQVALAIFTMSDPSFGSATDATPGGRITALSVPKTTTGEDAASTGTVATWFRAKTSAGTAVVDGTVGTSGTDMVIDNTTIADGQTVNLTAWTITMPES